MTDDANVIPPAAVTDPSLPNALAPGPNGAPQKSPLEILEEILGKQKGAGGAPMAGAEPPAPPEKPAAPAEPTEAEQAAKLEVIEQQEAAYKIRDDAAAAETVQQIRAAAQDPTYQAVMEKEKTAAADQTQKDNAQAGFDIKQLAHKKI